MRNTRETYAEEFERVAQWLDAQGRHIEADGERYLAAQALAPRPAAVQHCDTCGAVVTSSARLALFDAMGVDWVLCGTCLG